MAAPYVIDDDGDEVTLPYRMEVCPQCNGKGSRVNPAIDGNGICSDDEIWQDEDFREGYFSGRYDIVCDECNGRNVVEVLDREACKPSLLAMYDEQEAALYESYAMSAMERAMGC
jgi:RecJ-like exonuclease